MKQSPLAGMAMLKYTLNTSLVYIRESSADMVEVVVSAVLVLPDQMTTSDLEVELKTDVALSKFHTLFACTFLSDVHVYQ